MTDVLEIALPDPLRREIDRLAKERGISAAEFIALAAAEKAAAIEEAAAYFRSRAARAVPGTARAFFTRTGGEPPREGDELP